MPTLVIVAGPNGSGKTSLLRSMAEKNLVIGEWINPDEIAETEFGGWNDTPSILLAANEAQRRRELALKEGRDFTFETVLSAPDKLAFAARAKEAGYFLRVYFVATKSPRINAGRVTGRYLQGGHSVPLDKIANRYIKSLANAPRLIALADRAQLFDNSIEGRGQRHIMTFVDGAHYRTRVAGDEVPEWVSVVLKEIESTNQRS